MFTSLGPPPPKRKESLSLLACLACGDLARARHAARSGGGFGPGGPSHGKTDRSQRIERREPLIVSLYLAAGSSISTVNGLTPDCRVSTVSVHGLSFSGLLGL